MSDIVRLLERKAKILQSQLRLKDMQIKTMDYQIKNGRLPPVHETLSPRHVYQLEEKHAADLHVVELEIENIQLKEKLAELQPTNHSEETNDNDQ